MKNIYFKDEDITFNDIFFVCYMVERTARRIRQRNVYVVEKIGKAGLERQLSIAASLHCLNPEQVVAEWIDEFALESGNFDVTAVNTRFTDKVPTEIQMGKVYARLISSVTNAESNIAEEMLKLYASPICETIDNYNSSAYYEPSYVLTQAYLQGSF